MNVIEKLRQNGIDMENTLERFSGNQVLLEKFIKKFIDDETYNQLAFAVSQKQYDDMIHFAHTLKGISANMGFDQLQVACSALIVSLRAGKTALVERMFAVIAREYKKILDIITS